MLHILNKSSKKLELNTLFIQPTRLCTRNCKSCYVKEHISTPSQTDVREQCKLFNYFFYSEKGIANQITVSMDDPPRDCTHMYDLFIHILTTCKNKGSAPAPEIQLTFNSVETIKNYLNWISAPIDVIRHLDLISVSSVENAFDQLFLEEVRKLGVHVNFNHMRPHNVDPLNINGWIEDLNEIGESVDSIYLILSKTPVGKERNDLIEIRDRSRMQSDIQYIDTVMKRLSPDVRNKVNIDGCLKDIIKNRKTGFGCSSNVSRFQVWPDGSVSGCPYLHGSNSSSGKTADDILQNIHEARKTYDFEQCHLTQVYENII